MRASAMLSVAVAATAAALSLTLVQSAPRASAATLDRVDADGVTEVGGSAAYARMLPRTGSDGLLSATLLPPVADWGSKPVTNVYYVAANAASAGNGSPQYPFKALGTALSSVSSSSAFVLAPATYSASFTLASGRSVAICGFGPSSYISSLTVTAAGTSANTTLCLYGVRVGTLTVNGGRVNVRLMQAYVNSLAGSASAATVTRADMGSVVNASTLAHAYAYAGYDRVPLAGALYGTGLDRLFLSGGRALVSSSGGTNTVAYVSDVAAATNSAFGAVQALQAEDVRIAGLVGAEADARAAADTSLSNSFATAYAELAARLLTVDSTWGDNVTYILGRVSSVSSDIASLRTKEANDVSALSNAVATAVAGAKADDSTLAVLLTNKVAAAVHGLRLEVPGLADAQIDAARAGIVHAAVTQAVAQAVSDADALSRSRDAGITSRVANLEAARTSLQASVSSNTARISVISNNVNALSGEINTFSNRCDTINNRITALANGRVHALETDLAELGGDVEDVAGTIGGHVGISESTINSIIDCLNVIKTTLNLNSMTVPSKITH